MSHPTPFARPVQSATLSLALALGLAGCDWSSSSGTTDPVIKDDSGNGSVSEVHVGVIATAASDYGSGAVELAALGEEEITASGGYFPTISDIAVNAYGQHYYRFERYGADTVQKVDVENPAIEDWKYSTLEEGDESSSNPYQLVFVNDEKAYLIRYDQSEAWVVDPSASSESDFFSGEALDLSAYVPADSIGAPNMSSGVIVDGKLFITLQRLDSSYQPTNTAYVAVFDTATDTEIDTGMGIDGLKGIPLNGTNPGSISYHEDFGLIVQNTGSFYAPFGGTGIDTIDPTSYSVSTLVSDGDVDFQINDVVVVSTTQAYTLSYAGWQDVTVQSFDPSAGSLAFTTVADLSGSDYRDIELSPENTLWVADATVAAPGVQIIDITTDEIVDFVETSLLPIDLAFATVTITE